MYIYDRDILKLKLKLVVNIKILTFINEGTHIKKNFIKM